MFKDLKFDWNCIWRVESRIFDCGESTWIVDNLKEIYNYKKTIILLKACYNWMHLKLQDFKIVDEYNFVVLKRISELKLCGGKYY